MKARNNNVSAYFSGSDPKKKTGYSSITSLKKSSTTNLLSPPTKVSAKMSK
jgi:hypothetical protein